MYIYISHFVQRAVWKRGNMDRWHLAGKINQYLCYIMAMFAADFFDTAASNLQK